MFALGVRQVACHWCDGAHFERWPEYIASCMPSIASLVLSSIGQLKAVQRLNLPARCLNSWHTDEAGRVGAIRSEANLDRDRVAALGRAKAHFRGPGRRHALISVLASAIISLLIRSVALTF